MQLPSILVSFGMSGTSLSLDSFRHAFFYKRATCIASINPSDFWFFWTSVSRNYVDCFKVFYLELSHQRIAA